MIKVIEAGTHALCRCLGTVSFLWISMAIGSVPLDAAGAAADHFVPVYVGNSAAARLRRTDWTLVWLGNQSVVAAGKEREAYLSFSKSGQVTGSTGCNRLTGPYQLKRNRLTFGQLASTRMLCTENGDLEARDRSK